MSAYDGATCLVSAYIPDPFVTGMGNLWAVNLVAKYVRFHDTFLILGTYYSRTPHRGNICRSTATLFVATAYILIPGK